MVVIMSGAGWKRRKSSNDPVNPLNSLFAACSHRSLEKQGKLPLSLYEMQRRRLNGQCCLKASYLTFEYFLMKYKSKAFIW